MEFENIRILHMLFRDQVKINWRSGPISSFEQSEMKIMHSFCSIPVCILMQRKLIVSANLLQLLHSLVN